MHKIITFFGQFNTGKDEAANLLCQKLNNDRRTKWFRNSIASNVKRIYCETFGVDMDFIERWKRRDEIPEGFSMSVRNGLTFIGDGFRKIKQDVWLEMIVKQIQGNTILSDGRYCNEARFFREMGGINILVWRPKFENDFPNASEQELMPYVHQLKEQAEGEVDNELFDYWLINNGDLADLTKKVYIMQERLL